tara:strand:+ start:174 stop:1067 length:894 start_codon:yes stop_codon:yes gene_type:complete
MTGPLAAIITTLFFLMLGILFAPFFAMSSAIIALITLRQGYIEGLKIAISASALYCGFSMLAFNQSLNGIIFPLLMWLPLIMLAYPLRQSQNYDYSFILIALLMSGYSLLFRGVVDDLQGFWASKIQAVVDVISAEAALDFSLAQIQYLSGQIHLWWLIFIECALVVTLFYARYLQSRLYNPAGFAEEFKKIQLPRFWLWFLLVVAILNVFQRAGGSQLPLSGDLLAILLVFFSFQGLAVVHFRNHLQGLSVGWLVGLYVFLFLVPQVVGFILAVTGIFDTLADFRGLRKIDNERDE